MRFRADPLRRLERVLGYRFRRRQLLELALAHRSYANEAELEENNERLEFLGDSILGMIVAELLYERFPKRQEGELSKIKSQMVSATALAGYAGRLELGEHLRLGVGEERSGGSTKPSLLADCFEAVIGAIYLDSGLKAARKAVVSVVEASIDGWESRAADDPKTRLQEVAQGKGQDLPEYRLLAEHGPDHRKRFTFECLVAGQRLGVGEGSSKKQAEQRAAAAALRQLKPQS